MTIVTAIVSPSARPSPRIMPPMMPERAYGSTASQIISQRVAPSASAASRCERGTAIKHFARDGRDVRQHHDRENAARRRACSARTRGPEKSGSPPRCSVSLMNGITCPRRNGTSTKIAPEAVDDARNRGEQIDERTPPAGGATGRELREKDRDAHRERRRDEQRDGRRHHRAENRWRGAEIPLHGVPRASVKNPKPKR